MDEENVVDTLVIEAKGKVDNAVSGIDKLVKTLNRVKTSLKGVGIKAIATEQAMKGFNASLDGISDKGIDKIERLTRSLAVLSSVKGIKLPKGLADSIVDLGGAAELVKEADFTRLTASLKSLSEVGKISIQKDIADKIIEIGGATELIKDVDFTKLNEMANGLMALSGIGKISVPKVNVGGVKGNVAEDSGVIDAGTVEQTVDAVEDANNAVDELNDKLDETNQKTQENGTAWERVKKILSGVKENIKNAFSKGILGKLTNLFRLLGKRVLYRTLNAAISAVVESFKYGIKSVYEFSETINGQFVDSMDNFARATNYFKNSIGAMVAPLINMAIPVFDEFINNVVELINRLNEMFAMWGGQGTWIKAIRSDTLKWIDSTDDANSSAKKLQKTLLGFDEINRLDGRNGSSKNKNNDWIFEEVAVDELRAKEMENQFNKILDIVKLIGVTIAGWKVGSSIAQLFGLTGGNGLLATGGAGLLGLSLFDVFTGNGGAKSLWEGMLGGAMIGGSIGGVPGAIVGGAVVTIGEVMFDENTRKDLERIGGDIFKLFSDDSGIALQGVKDLDDWCRKNFGDDWTNFWEEAGKGVHEFTQMFSDDTETSTKAIAKWDKKIRGILPDWWVNTFESLGKGIQEFIDGAGKFFQSCIDWWSKLWEGVGKSIQQFVQGIIDFFGGVGNGIGDFFGGIVDGVGDAVNGIFNTAGEVKKTVAYSPVVGGGTNTPTTSSGFDPTDFYRQKYRGYANGGTVKQGDLFIANERGAELVGGFGGTSGVANNEMIITAMYRAVKDALMETQNNNSGEQRFIVELDGDVLAETVNRKNAIANRRMNGRFA